MNDPAKWKAVALTVLGLAAMVGDFADIEELRGLATATAASPAPKVFSTARGLETFSSRFVIEYEHKAQGRRTFELTPSTYALLGGPYNRRNVYGAVASYGPVLASAPATAALFDSVARYSFCPPAPLLAELGLDPSQIVGAPVLRVIPRKGTTADLPLRLKVNCR